MADSEAFTFDWDESSFDSLESFTEKLSEAGFKLSLWEYPYLKRGSDLFREAATNGYLVMDGKGDPYILRRPSSSELPFTRFGIVDFTNEDAQEWWQEYHRRLILNGVNAFKLDFAEYLPADCITSSKQSGEILHNIYPTLYADTVSEAFDSSDTPPVLWVRAGWTGTQRFPIHWGGDSFCTFESFAATVRGGLSLSLSGYPFWSCDAGGYDGKPDKILYIRWLQWCLLGLSHVRLHGKTPREPWEFGDVAIEVARK
ncbi:MAG: TIM-barrel domain-containing protein, partial [Halobacteriaceae archaeon]